LPDFTSVLCTQRSEHDFTWPNAHCLLPASPDTGLFGGAPQALPALLLL